MTDDPIKIAWLAGILEGEGCFGFRKNGAWLCLAMTDRDVIEEAKRLMSCQHLGVVIRYKDGKQDRKVVYQIRPHGDAAVAVMRRILPYMKERRGNKIRWILSLHEDFKYKKANFCKRGHDLRIPGVVRYKRHIDSGVEYRICRKCDEVLKEKYRAARRVVA